MNIIIPVLVILVLAILIPSPVKEALSGLGLRLPDWSFTNLHRYNNTCLTKKSFGFPSHNNIYKYWKDRPKSWAIEYSEERVRGNIDQVRSSKSSENGSLIPIAYCTVNPRYYHNPEQYCKKNSNQYPCPNHWRPGPHDESLTHTSGLLSNEYGHVRNRY